MLRFLRRRWIAVAAVALLLVVALVTEMRVRRPPPPAAEAESAEAREAPSDLQRLRDPFLKGRAALLELDGATAVRHLSSFTFGPRVVEEYRLYLLAQAYELSEDDAAARLTLARLWRRTPKLIHAAAAAETLAQKYASAGQFQPGGQVYATLARGSTTPSPAAAAARWQAAAMKLKAGDPAGAAFHARALLIQNPGAPQAADANSLYRALTGLPPETAIPLTSSERLERATNLATSGKHQEALAALDALEPHAPQLRSQLQLQRGITLRAMRRFEDSNNVLEPLTSGPYKYAIPALRHAARNYGTLAAAINPEVTKTVKERKRVGTIRQRVGKGKKRRTVTKPKYQTVFRQVKLVDLAKKAKKEELDRLASERLKDLLQLPIDEEIRIETLNALIERATAKSQDSYVQELVPQLVKLDPQADPALQYFWDKGWAAYTRGELGAARKTFRFIADTYTHPNIRRQSEYWYARCAERQGEKEEADAVYQKLASGPYEDLYAQHSVRRGATAAPPVASPLKEHRPDWRDLAEKEMPGELRIAYELSTLSAMREALLEARANLNRRNTRFAHAVMADVYHAEGNDLLMYGSLRKAWPQLATVEQDTVPLYFFRMYYPMKYSEAIEKYAAERDLDPNLVRGLILQESYYNPEAKSRVGATGLMQLMPPTAKEHAAKLRIPFAVSRLENPEINVRLGTYHLRMLVTMFKGNTYLAVASYNAGQGNVMKWQRAAPGKPLDEFLESIPFPETRNYVKRVTLLRSTYTRLNSST